METASSTSNSKLLGGFVGKGALWAIPMFLAMHGLMLALVYPEPVARARIRTKTEVLTLATQPTRSRVIVAGDSRAMCGIDPHVLAAGLGIRSNSVINIADSMCDSATAAAVIREFRERFSRRPLVILSVSAFGLSYRGSDVSPTNATFYWNLSPQERLGQLGVSNLWTGVFLPERVFGWRLIERMGVPNATTHEAYLGHLSLPSDAASATNFQETVNTMRNLGWFGQPGPDVSPNGTSRVSWRQFARDVRTLQSLGTDVVVLDIPLHPGLAKALAQSQLVESAVSFAAELDQACAVLDVPVLRYVAPQDADAMYVDGIHASRLGATYYSSLVARDLRSAKYRRYFEALTRSSL